MNSSDSSITISAAPPVWKAADWSALRAAGLAYVEQYAHDRWTDYNRHDPGITILEALCYAITDLSQRTSLEVKDLLRSSYADDLKLAAAFATAGDALTTHPVTEMDYRRLLLDVPGVRNVWFQALPSTFNSFNEAPDTISTPRGPKQYDWVKGAPPTYPVVNPYEFSIQGLYRIIVDLDPLAIVQRSWALQAAGGGDVIDLVPNTAQLAAATAALCADVRAAYNRRRNLGEDCVSVEVAQPTTLAIKLQVDLTLGADAVAVQAAVLYAINQFLTPPVPRYSLDELLALTDEQGRPLPVDELFEGPLPTRGFTRPADLTASDNRQKIYLSDMVSLVLAVPGVAAVRELVLNPSMPSANKWSLPVSATQRLQVELSDVANGNFVFYQNQTQVSYDKAKIMAIYDELAGRNTSTQDKPVRELAMPLGTLQDISTYQPLALDFPATYGIAPNGLPANASTERRHLARQLQAYLLIFDQLLTNYLAQLAHANDLLTLDVQEPVTYFGQQVNADTLPTQDPLYVSGTTPADPSWLSGSDQQAVDLNRKRRFLDHLLARFGENFPEHDRLRYSAQGPPTPAQALAHRAALASDLLNFHPARAFDYTVPSWVGDPEPSSGTGEPGGGGPIGTDPIGFEPIGGQSNSQQSDEHLASEPSTPSLDNGEVDNPDTGVSSLAVSDETPNDLAARTNMAGIIRRFGRLIGMKDFRARWTVGTDAPVGYKLRYQHYHYSYVLHALGDSNQQYVQSNNPSSAAAAATAAYAARILGRVRANWHVLTVNEFDTTELIDLANGMYIFGLTDPEVSQSPSGYTLEAMSMTSFPSAEAAEAALNEVVEALQGEEETIHLVEHVLLLPPADVRPDEIEALGLSYDKLKPDIDTNATNMMNQYIAEPRDPYSYRVSIVLPGYAARFQNPEYRSYAERVLRTELPAHIFPQIFWLDDVDEEDISYGREEMRRFEDKLHAWLKLKRTPVARAESSVTNNAPYLRYKNYLEAYEKAHRELVAKLNSFRSQYEYPLDINNA